MRNLAVEDETMDAHTATLPSDKEKAHRHGSWARDLRNSLPFLSLLANAALMNEATADPRCQAFPGDEGHDEGRMERNFHSGMEFLGNFLSSRSALLMQATLHM